MSLEVESSATLGKPASEFTVVGLDSGAKGCGAGLVSEVGLGSDPPDISAGAGKLPELV